MKAAPNPSLLPLNVSFIDKVSGQLADQLLKSDSLIAERTIQVRRADGKRHKVWINVLSRSWLKGRLPGTLFVKLAQHHDPEDDPEAWDKTKTITIQLDADLIHRYLETDTERARALLRRDLRLILLHELTHSAEPKLTDAKYSMTEATFKSYYRDPQEVRARTREVVDSILQGNPKARVRDYLEAWAGGYRGTLVEFLADTTEQWRHMHPFLETEAEKRALQMIERALRDKKIDTSGKGLLPNPSWLREYGATENPGELLAAMEAISLATPFDEMAVGALVGAAIGSVAGTTSTEAMSAPTFAWRAYVSRLDPNKDPISEYVRQAKEGIRNPKMARYVASGLATLVRRRPEFDGVDAVVLIPRRGPEMENDLEPVGKILASGLGVRFIPQYLQRVRIPLGGRELVRRTRYPASEHAATMQTPVSRRVKKPLVLDNVLATGATLNGAYEAIRRDAKADPVGLVILWSPDFWQAPESDRMVRRKNP